jgi:hypothetical protein
MIYKEKSSGRTLDVAETDAAKRRILERSGWLKVPATVEPELAEPPTPPEPEPLPQPVDDLPEDFPEREALTAAGYGALLLVSKASDDELRAVKGVGKATLKAIRDYANHG